MGCGASMIVWMLRLLPEYFFGRVGLRPASGEMRGEPERTVVSTEVTGMATCSSPSSSSVSSGLFGSRTSTKMKYSSALSSSLSVSWVMSMVSATSGSSATNSGVSDGEGGRPKAAGMAGRSGDEEADDKVRIRHLSLFSVSLTAAPSSVIDLSAVASVSHYIGEA